MFLLSVAIIFSLLVTLGLPIIAALWLNKVLNVPWWVITYGVLAYFVVQALISLLFSGFSALLDNGTLSFSNVSFFIIQLSLSIGFGALFGVILRWGAMKYMKKTPLNLQTAYAIGVGYGGIESIIRVGLPLLMTFVSMVSNINVDPQTTALEPEIIAQIEALWQVPAYVPLAGSLERIAALVMHLTVTILILQCFTRKSTLWLGAAFGVELVINGLIVGLSEIGLAYGWVIALAVVFMVGNLYLLYRLNAFDLDLTGAFEDPVT